MTIKNIENKLKYLEGYDISKEEKIKFIEKMYKLAHINFENFVKNFDLD